MFRWSSGFRRSIRCARFVGSARNAADSCEVASRRTEEVPVDSHRKPPYSALWAVRSTEIGKARERLSMEENAIRVV